MLPNNMYANNQQLIQKDNQYQNQNFNDQIDNLPKVPINPHAQGIQNYQPFQYPINKEQQQQINQYGNQNQNENQQFANINRMDNHKNQNYGSFTSNNSLEKPVSFNQQNNNQLNKNNNYYNNDNLNQDQSKNIFTPQANAAQRIEQDQNFQQNYQLGQNRNLNQQQPIMKQINQEQPKDIITPYWNSNQNVENNQNKKIQILQNQDHHNQMNINSNRFQSDQNQNKNFKEGGQQKINFQSNSLQDMQFQIDENYQINKQLQNQKIQIQDNQNFDQQKDNLLKQQQINTKNSIGDDTKNQKQNKIEQWDETYQIVQAISFFKIPVPNFITPSLFSEFKKICKKLNQEVDDFLENKSNKDELKTSIKNQFYQVNQNILQIKKNKKKQKQNRLDINNQEIGQQKIKIFQPQNPPIPQKVINQQKPQAPPQQKINQGGNKDKQNLYVKNNLIENEAQNNFQKQNNNLNLHMKQEREKYQKIQPISSDAQSQSQKSGFSNNFIQKSVITNFEQNKITHEELLSLLKNMVNESNQSADLKIYLTQEQNNEQANKQNQRNKIKQVFYDEDFTVKNSQQFQQYISEFCLCGTSNQNPKQSCIINQFQTNGQLLYFNQQNIEKAITESILKQKICHQTDDQEIKQFLINELKNTKPNKFNQDQTMIRQIFLYCLSNQLQKQNQQQLNIKNIEFIDKICQYEVVCTLIYDHFKNKAFKMNKKNVNNNMINELANSNNITFIFIKKNQFKLSYEKIESKKEIIKSKKENCTEVCYLYFEENHKKIYMLCDLSDEHKNFFLDNLQN